MDGIPNLTEEETRVVSPPAVRLTASNFGPIAMGEIELRPLTVFVGPSNSGKTYFAILVYALHRIMGGISRFPVMLPHLSMWERFSKILIGADLEEHERNLRKFLIKLDTAGHNVRFSDLPRHWCELAQALLNRSDKMGADLKEELERCFDLDSVSSLILWSEVPKETMITLAVGEGGEDLWRGHIQFGTSGMSTKGHIEDIPLVPKALRASAKSRKFGSDTFPLFSKRGGTSFDPWDQAMFADDLFRLFSGNLGDRGAHYLPAARSGIMQSHRVIASSLVGRSTRAGLQRFPEVPTFSGIMADFMQRLILFRERKATVEPMEGLAKLLERDALAGEIRTSRSSPEAYPEFVFRQEKSPEDIRLTRASSMVTELAPIVLFLRGVINRNDLVIIEEPEAHLHPAAQTQLAAVLGCMVNAGLKVLVTTHSDWLLKEFGNLIREGELGEETVGNASNRSLRSSLRSHEVGTWLFRKDSVAGPSTVEEIPFDRIEGIEPHEYEDVAEQLYNRSASLQDRLENSDETGGCD